MKIVVSRLAFLLSKKRVLSITNMPVSLLGYEKKNMSNFVKAYDFDSPHFAQNARICNDNLMRAKSLKNVARPHNIYFVDALQRPRKRL